jgi:putative FmdB family regulatory protein
MPSYEFECRGCGRFEEVRDHREAPVATPCPACGGEAARRYGAPLVRAARLEASLGTASPVDRARLDRAADGAPATGGLPEGPGVRGLSSGGHRHAHGRHREAPRPWQLGH